MIEEGIDIVLLSKEFDVGDTVGLYHSQDKFCSGILIEKTKSKFKRDRIYSIQGWIVNTQYGTGLFYMTHLEIENIVSSREVLTEKFYARERNDA